jgi:hypothetical protein
LDEGLSVRWWNNKIIKKSFLWHSMWRLLGRIKKLEKKLWNE